jgi:hypothetical protein
MGWAEMTRKVYVVHENDKPVAAFMTRHAAKAHARALPATNYHGAFYTVHEYAPVGSFPGNRPTRWHWASKKGTTSQCYSGGLRVEHCSTDTYVTRVNCPTCMRRTTYKAAMQKVRTK